MFFAARNAGRRIVSPAIVLPRKTDMRSDLGILGHPAPPVGGKEGAKFFCRVRLRVRVWLLRIFCLGKREQRKSKGRAGHRQGKQHEHTNHYGFIPTASLTSMPVTLASLRPRVPFRVRAQASRSGARFPPHPSQCCRRGRHRRRAPAATLYVRGRAYRVRELLRGLARGTNFRPFPGALSSAAPRELRVTPPEIFSAPR